MTRLCEIKNEHNVFYLFLFKNVRLRITSLKGPKVHTFTFLNSKDVRKKEILMMAVVIDWSNGVAFRALRQDVHQMQLLAFISHSTGTCIYANNQQHICTKRLKLKNK